MAVATLQDQGELEMGVGAQMTVVLLACAAAVTLAFGFVPAVGAAVGTATVAGLLERRRDRLAPAARVNATCAPAAAGLHEFDEIPLSLADRFVKRSIDVVGALVGLAIFLPVLLIAAIAVKLDSPGPVLFTQERVGQCGRKFRILKLRTMHKNNDGTAHLEYVAALMRGEAHSEDGVFKLTADPRITRVGRTLRKLSIDEIPQLVNVLLGHMSLVGPRPPMAEEVTLYDEWTWQRLRVKPGLTGLWQVSGRCELDFHEMVELDLRYQEAWSPILELSILLKTPAAVLSARGAA